MVCKLLRPAAEQLGWGSNKEASLNPFQSATYTFYKIYKEYEFYHT